MLLSSPWQQEIDAPAAAAMQTVEPAGHELGNGATAGKEGSFFAHFCESHFPSTFSFKELKRKLILFHRPPQEQALPAAPTIKMKIAAPSVRQMHQAGQPGRKTHASPPNSCKKQDGLQDLEMDDGCDESKPSTAPVQKAVVKDQADTENAFKISTFKPCPILQAEDNHLIPPSNFTNRAFELAVGTSKDHRQPLSIGDDAHVLQLWHIFPASEREHNLSTEAGSGDVVNLQQGLPSWTVQVHTEDLSNELYEPKKDALAAANSEAPLNFQLLGNHTRTLLEERAAIDSISTSTQLSCKQITPLDALERMDDNIQEVEASSALVYMKTVEVQKERQVQRQGTGLLYRDSSNHNTLSVWESHADSNLRKRIAGAQGVVNHHQLIKVLRQSAMLDLAQARLILSQIDLCHNN